ncbi:MAG: hypothetical protein MUF04_03150 [Akkermansiaceae bacterium]|jgi:hypothetical protein|nr:hypothetical protein [Akkermansiaceae bacterium]
MATSQKQAPDFSRADVLAIMLTGLVAVFGALLWAVESWQRPHRLAGVREEWWLAAACAGAAVGLLGGGWRMRRRRRWLLLLPAAGFALFLPAAREVAAANAVRQLIEGFTTDDSRPPSKFEKTREALRDWLDEKQWPSRWLGQEQDGRNWKEQLSWASHRLEASRPDLRRRFALAAMHQDGPVRINGQLAVAHWRWLFPAVTGQDVMLTQRQRLWDELRKLHDDAQARPDSRMAAALWLGLIALSDPEAFAEWRPLARDALLLWHDPPYEDIGDVWMRALDLLLAFDSDAEQARLTAPLAARPAWLRRAVRERVRGVRPHLDAALAEIRRADAAGEHDAALALWADVRGFDASLPWDGDDSRVAAGLHEIIAGWLFRDGLAPEIAVTHRRRDYHDNYDYEAGFWEWLAVETADGLDRSLLAPATRARLDKRATELLAWLEEARARHLDQHKLPPTARTWLPDVDRLLVLRTLSDTPGRDGITRRLGDIMVDLAWIRDGPEPPETQLLGHDGIFRRLAEIWPDIRPADRERFNRLARSGLPRSPRLWGRYEHVTNFSRSWLVALDTASETPQFRSLECLVACFPYPGQYSFHARNDRPAAPQSDGRLLFPEITGPELAAAIQELVAMINAAAKGTGENPWSLEIGRLRQAMRRDHLGLPPAESVRLQLFLAGLIGERELSQQGLPDGLHPLEQRSLLRPWDSDLLWQTAVTSPAKARALLESLGSEAEILDGFADYLARSSPDPTVIREVVTWLESATAAPDAKLAFAAHAALLRLATAGLAPGLETIRARFLHAFHTRQPALDEWPVESYRNLPDQWGPRSRWSEQVPWADDALAAEFAWSSQIKRETGFRAHAIDEPSHGPVFTYLAANLDFTLLSWDYLSVYSLPEATSPVRSVRRRGGPPALPLEPTPWQRARELHQRRPDLTFPDRAALRCESAE